MNMKLLAAVAATALIATGASAETVSNTSLQNINGTVGTPGVAGVLVPATVTTTTTATGTRTSVSAAAGDNAGANRAQGTPVLNSWYQANLGFGSTVGITTDYARSGNGSAYFSQVQAQNGKADLQYNIGSGGVVAPVALASLTSFSYDWFRDVSSGNDPLQVTSLRLLMLKNGADAGALIFEPYYTDGGARPEGVWATSAGSLTSGNWWTNNGSLGPTFAAGDGSTKTLAEWIAGNVGSTLSVYGFQIGFGSGWTETFTGAVDNVNIAFGATAFNSNFEVASATAGVPEPATWAMMIGGFGLVGAAMRRRQAAVRFA